MLPMLLRLKELRPHVNSVQSVWQNRPKRELAVDKCDCGSGQCPFPLYDKGPAGLHSPVMWACEACLERVRHSHSQPLFARTGDSTTSVGRIETYGHAVPIFLYPTPIQPNDHVLGIGKVQKVPMRDSSEDDEEQR